MLYHLLYPLHVNYSFLNVFKYITFRALGAALFAIMISLLFGGHFIRYLQRKQLGQTIRDDGPQTHLKKKGTPTMGGGLILAAITFGIFFFADWLNPYIWLTFFVTITFGAIGWYDDYLKISKKNPKGFSGKYRFALELLVSGIVGYILVYHLNFSTVLKFPFFKEYYLDLGVMFIPFAMFIITGTGNAVNFTDGLDGLAIGPVIINAITLGLLAYLAGHVKIAQYLQIPYIEGVGELSVYAAAIATAGLGFLWYNTYPAQVFMGDVGSLSLGGTLGTIALLTKNEILLAIMGGVYVIETLSVITQVISFKTTGKRIFKMAPIHHHFELKGWAEPKVIVRFWIISIILSIIAVSTLKLR